MALEFSKKGIIDEAIEVEGSACKQIGMRVKDAVRGYKDNDFQET